MKKLTYIAASVALMFPMMVSATSLSEVNDKLSIAIEQNNKWNSEADAILVGMNDNVRTAIEAYQRAINESESLGDVNKALSAIMNHYATSNNDVITAATTAIAANEMTMDDLAAYLHVAKSEQELDAALAAEGITANDVVTTVDQYGQAIASVNSITATNELVIKPLEQAQFDESSRVLAYQHTLERDEILDTLKTQPDGLWVQAFQNNLSNSELRSKNGTVAVGYGHSMNPNLVVGGYVSRSNLGLNYRVGHSDVHYQDGYGVGVYGLYQMGRYALNVLMDFKHHHASYGYNIKQQSQKSYGVLIDLDYKALDNERYSLVPSVQYQYNRVSGSHRVNLHQLGAKLSGKFQVSTSTSLLASLGLAGVYATNPSAAYDTTVVDIRSYGGDLNQYAVAGNNGFAEPYPFTTVKANGKRKNQADGQVSVKLAVKHQFNKQTSLSTSVGYHAYTRTKLKDFGYGLNFQYQF